MVFSTPPWYNGSSQASTGSKGSSGLFLLASFQNHFSDQIDRARRLKKPAGDRHHAGAGRAELAADRGLQEALR
jgi:hypothetical protein